MMYVVEKIGGPGEVRTPDPMVANHVLSQLSYRPLLVSYQDSLRIARAEPDRRNGTFGKPVIPTPARPRPPILKGPRRTFSAARAERRWAHGRILEVLIAHRAPPK